MKRIISFILFVTLILNLTINYTYAFSFDDESDGLGYITSLDQEVLSFGLVYSELSSKKDKNQKTYIFEYSPNNYTQPQVFYAAGDTTKMRLKDITASYEDNGVRVVGAMNGDFFSFETGIPMGVVIKDGILISSDPSKNAIGFTDSGNAVIGTPDIHFSLSLVSDDDLSDSKSKNIKVPEKEDREPYTIKFDYLNKYPSVYALYMINDSYSKTTRSTSSGTEVVLKPVSGMLKVNTEMIFEVTEIRQNIINGDIPENHFVLYGDDRSFASELKDMCVGDILSLNISGNTDWENIVTAMGGGDIILKNGIFAEDSVDELHEKIKNPRTAIGIRENGEIVFFANDGRDSNNAAGFDLSSLAQVMKDLECVTAINLDGGGSTTVYATTPFDETAKLVNNPSDGSERYISNAILFLNNLPQSRDIGGIKITADSEYVLPGSTIELNPIYHDKTYHPFTPETDAVYSEQTYTKTPRGNFENNIFTALKPGYTILSAVNNGIKGLLDITVLSSPSEIYSSQSEICIEIGDKIQLDFSASYYGTPVIFNNFDVLTYKITDTEYEDPEPNYKDLSSVGFVQNNFMNATNYFEGFLEASMGETSLKIPLKIIPKSYYLNIPTSDLSLVQESLFELTNMETLSYMGNEYITISRNEHTESDKIESEINIDDSSVEEDFCTLDYSFELPENAKAIEFIAKGDVDSVLVVTDNNNNEVTLPYSVTKDYSVFNGWKIYSADLSTLTTNDETTYKIKSILHLSSSFLPATIGGFKVITGEQKLFTDIENSWAKQHIEDVYYQELMNGKPYYTSTYFDGDAILTRAEFATILCRLLKINLDEYKDLKPDFADIEKIGDWAWRQIYAVSSLGIMNGSLENDGKYYFRPQDSITRAEAMHVIGKLILPAEQSVTLSFKDSDSLPSWSVENITKVVSHKIISGYDDNTIRPSNKLTRNEAAKIFSLFNKQSYFDLLIQK
ncbi:MAG: phosphodiester glycosidase family protein [Clostridia bacterium]|nr:phosphodiester glycosidase family protein [Clostridia bacterium]